MKYKVGYIAGVFDLFHIGHLNVIRNAKERCDYLIVGVVIDEISMHFKNKRPFVPHNERLEIVAALKYVDEAVTVTFENIDRIDAWKQFHYDCLFSGDDYANDPYWAMDREKLNELGSDIQYFPYTKTTSSSAIQELINKRLL